MGSQPSKTMSFEWLLSSFPKRACRDDRRLDVCGLSDDERRDHRLGGRDARATRTYLFDRCVSRKRGASGCGQSIVGHRVLFAEPGGSALQPLIWRFGDHRDEWNHFSLFQDRARVDRSGNDALLELDCAVGSPKLVATVSAN